MRLATALLGCLLACPALPAEEVSLAIVPGGPGVVLVSVELTGADRPRLLAALGRGLESAVTFELRLYERTSGLRALFGDRLVGKKDLARRASMDFLDERYILDEEGGETRQHSGAEDFVADFLSVRSLRLPWSARAGTYLIARAHVDYVRLEPPLHIVNLFRPTGATTVWRRVELGGGGPR
jgi:hypothetical protein